MYIVQSVENQESYSYNFNWSSQLNTKFEVSYYDIRHCHCSLAHGDGDRNWWERSGAARAPRIYSRESIQRVYDIRSK